MRSGLASLVIVALAISTGCADREFDPPDPQLRVDAAHLVYTPALFDTVDWPNDSVRAHTGNEVFASRCRVCHGEMGEGTTEYARSQGLTVPSLVEPSWPLAASIDSVRHRVYVGHAGGMPASGTAGITAREIDAASFYVLSLLRPEVLRR